MLGIILGIERHTKDFSEELVPAFTELKGVWASLLVTTDSFTINKRSEMADRST